MSSEKSGIFIEKKGSLIEITLLIYYKNRYLCQLEPSKSMETTNIIYNFSGISLAQMDGVKLMNRTDRKYWFNIEHLAALLELVKDDYFILEVDSKRDLPYQTTYYDTPEDEMYNTHHRGKKSRYKIRRRNYISTQSSFLEIKYKNNKGRTIKRRRASLFDKSHFDLADEEFINHNSPYATQRLRKVLDNEFNRLMLVSKAMNERCTIDSELLFKSNNTQVKLEGLVIVEVKSEGHNYSPIIEALNALRLKPSGFSKYCMGRSLTDRTLKSNRFKIKHREIEKKTKTKLL